MSGLRKGFLGLDGFVWFLGVVENRMDPLLLGRVQVRAFGLHTSTLTSIPSEDLPWAHVMMPTNTAVVSTPKEGDYVIGFFLDGDSAQSPVVMGILPGIPTATPPISEGFSDQRKDLAPYPTQDVKGTSTRYPNRLNEPTLNRLARNQNLANTVIELIKNQKVGIEPETSYAAVYPFNNAMVSESGHAFELDDTPKAERVNLAHRTGTYIEMKPDGTMSTKIVSNNYTVILNGDNISIGGDCTVDVGGECKVNILGNASITCNGDVVVSAAGNMNLKSQKDITLTAADNISLYAGAGIALDAPGGINAIHGSIATPDNLSAGAAASGTFTDTTGQTIHVQSGIVTNIY
jgi:hypothetical protein